MRKSLSILLILSVVLLCFSGCAGDYKAVDGLHTTYEGVYISIDSIESGNGSDKTLQVLWHNETENYISYGLGYKIEYLDSGEWKDVQRTDFAIIEIACTIEGGDLQSQSYSTKYFNTFKKGSYRILVEFYIPELDVGAQSTWAEFIVE